jgi:DNA-binding NarL/FixJ family response regulator
MTQLILLVDDDALALGVRRLVLEAACYEVLTASSASQALESVSLQRFDLVITDNAVTSSGQGLAAEIRRLRPTSGHNTFWWVHSTVQVPASRLFSPQIGWTGKDAGEGFVCDSGFHPGVIRPPLGASFAPAPS